MTDESRGQSPINRDVFSVDRNVRDFADKLDAIANTSASPTRKKQYQYSDDSFAKSIGISATNSLLNSRLIPEVEIDSLMDLPPLDLDVLDLRSFQFDDTMNITETAAYPQQDTEHGIGKKSPNQTFKDLSIAEYQESSKLGLSLNEKSHSRVSQRPKEFSANTRPASAFMYSLNQRPVSQLSASVNQKQINVPNQLARPKSITQKVCKDDAYESRSTAELKDLITGSNAKTDVHHYTKTDVDMQVMIALKSLQNRVEQLENDKFQSQRKIVDLESELGRTRGLLYSSQSIGQTHNRIPKEVGQSPNRLELFEPGVFDSDFSVFTKGLDESLEVFGKSNDIESITLPKQTLKDDTMERIALARDQVQNLQRHVDMVQKMAIEKNKDLGHMGIGTASKVITFDELERSVSPHQKTMHSGSSSNAPFAQNLDALNAKKVNKEHIVEREVKHIRKEIGEQIFSVFYYLN